MPSVALLEDVMNRSVHVVAPFTSVKTVARTLTENQVGALPVVDGAGVVVGLVSEADLVARIALAPESGTGVTAAGVMSAPAITAPADLPVRQAAELMHRRRIRHLPVVDDNGRLLGIVSRGDLLRLFLRGDDDLRRRVVDDVLPRLGWLNPRLVTAEVEGGVVELRGTVPSRGDVESLARVVARVDGVVGVNTDELGWDHEEGDRRGRLGLPFSAGL